MHTKNYYRLVTVIYILAGLPILCGAETRNSDKVTDYFVVKGTANSNITRVPPGNSKRKPNRSLQDYQTEIDRVELEQGAYGSLLSEHLVGLGLTHQKQGQHEEAIEAFKRAMHINRINEGLYSLGQVPMLERMIESHIAKGQWEKANDRHHYLFWLHKRNFGASDPRMLPVIDKLSNWHLNSYALDMGSGLLNHLVSAHKLYNLAVNIIDSNYGQHDLRLINALKGLTVSNYYLATYKKSEAKPAFQVKTGADPSEAEAKAQLEQYINNSYNSGKRAIRRMVNVYANNPESPPWAEAKAKVELGDWYLLFNKWQSAMNMYQESHDSLIASNINQKEVDALFGYPVALPDLPLIDSTVVKDEEQSYVLVSFNVTPYGRVTNVKILDSKPQKNVRMRSQVRKALKVAKFRPRFENGAPALTENVTHRYLFSHE